MKDTYKDSFVEFDGESLKIGNAGILREWNLSDGPPSVVSVLDRTRNREWADKAPYRASFRSPALPIRGKPDIKIGADEDDVLGVSEKHLCITVRLGYENARLSWVHRVWPGLPVVLSQFSIRKTVESEPVEPESFIDKGHRRFHPTDDRLDFFGLKPLHMTCHVTTFIGRSDDHDNLVKERTFTMYPEEHIREPGHFLHIVDRVTSCGLLAMKIGPPPDDHLSYPGHDFVCSCRTLAIAGTGVATADLEALESAATYSYAVGVTDGIKQAGLDLCHALNRKRFLPTPERNFGILSNTWGDGNEDKRISETMFANELKTAAKLGITHCQMDAGWEKGRYANFTVEEKDRKSPYEIDPDFWTIDSDKFPRGLAPIVSLASKKGLRLGFWFVPDPTNDYANWRRDADVVLGMRRKYGFQAVKIDGAKIRTKRAEANFLSFLRTIHEEGERELCMNFDITGGRSMRLGHFYGNEFVGNLFIENRYALKGSYYTFRTLRNLWQLSRYIPSYRLQMECVNTAICSEHYIGDPLAPRTFGTEFSCAAVLFANPLCWMEVAQLSRADQKALSRLLHAYRPHQAAILMGRIHPIGEEPDGRSWTGFQSVTGENEGYMIVFREATGRSAGRFVLHDIAPGIKLKLERIAGNSRLRKLKAGDDRSVSVSLPRERSYALFRYSSAGNDRKR